MIGNIDILVKELCKLPKETGWVEFKHNNCEPSMIGEDDSTKVTLFSEMEFSNIPMEDKLWSCYLHACLMYIQGDALTNKSLRDRFNVGETSAGSISRLIKEAVSQGRIKALDSDTAKRYMRYIPIWA